MKPIDLLVKAEFLYPVSEGMPIIYDGKVVMRERQLSGLDHKATLEKLQKRLPRWRSQLSTLGSPAVFGPSCDCCGLV